MNTKVLESKSFSLIRLHSLRFFIYIISNGIKLLQSYIKLLERTIYVQTNQVSGVPQGNA